VTLWIVARGSTGAYNCPTLVAANSVSGCEWDYGGPVSFRADLSYSIMQKRPQFALMGCWLTATFLLLSTLMPAEVRSGSGQEVITAATDESGHTVYVSESAAAPSAKVPASRARQSSLVFWSVTEHKWKPVPAANIRAARSAAAEVDQSIIPNLPISGLSGTLATERDINAAIDEAASRHNVDPNLVRAVIKVESNFNPNAVSRKGAMGLMQLMPQTARQLNVTNPFDPQQNVDAGVRHLKKLMESYGGDVNLTLAAYNAGAGAVARSAGVPHFAETQNYVKRIKRLYAGAPDAGSRFELSNSVVGSREPVRVQRDARGVLYISNTD
jgi:soluble lytic murein transglycosylase-like protein